jgi:hypothetical protein
MNVTTAPRKKCAIFAAALAIGILSSRGARADVSILKTDTWELYTRGRVGGFFSYGWGDGNPLTRPNENLPLGGGLNTGNDTVPKIGPDGMPLMVQGTFRSMRVRSGFVPNQLGIGLRRTMSEDTTAMAYIGIWATIDSESQRKATPVFADAREGYLKIESKRWGTLLAGRALDLFSRGATENDFLYGHGYGLGFPGNIDTFGPTNGMIGFGVLAAFFSPGIVYATPRLVGLQLTAGIYDPTTLPGAYESTRDARPEAELTYDYAGGPVKLHLFGNYAFQQFNKPGSNDYANGYGAGYGGRIEVGPVHLGVAGHYGKGLGLQYAFQPGSVSVTATGALRWFDGYSVLGQVVAGPFDINAGWGMARVLLLDEDKVPGVNISLPEQQAFSGGVVYHATDYFHVDVDYIHAQAKWTLGEQQTMDFINTGFIVTW